jgi:hypothetical protein
VHLARDALGLGVDAFGGAVAVRKCECGDHGIAVSLQAPQNECRWGRRRSRRRRFGWHRPGPLNGNLVIRVRDAWGPMFSDEQFAGMFPARTKPAWSPGRLAMVPVLQFVEALTDRKAAEAVRARTGWKCALAPELAYAGIDFSVLSTHPGSGSRRVPAACRSGGDHCPMLCCLVGLAGAGELHGDLSSRQRCASARPSQATCEAVVPRTAGEVADRPPRCPQ